MRKDQEHNVSFGLITDCQYVNHEDETYTIPANVPMTYNCTYRDSPRKLQDAIRFFNTRKLDFIVHLGDFIDRDVRDIKILNNVTDQSIAPLWHVLGNHEYKDKTHAIEHVVDLYQMPARYYTKEVGNYKFIIIDSSEEGVIAHQEDTPAWDQGVKLIQAMQDEGLPNAHPWNGGIGNKQLRWVESQIQDAESKGQYTILFSHHPIFPPGPLNMLNDIQFLSMINKYKSVKGFFNGHNHLGNYYC